MSEIKRELSSFLAIKGPLVEETYRAFRDWNFDSSAKANLTRILETNSIGASSSGWLRDVGKVLNRRYDLEGKDRMLIRLAQESWHLDEWRPVQLWHIAQNDELLRTFIVNWLYSQCQKGIVIITTDSVNAFLNEVLAIQFAGKADWSETTLSRVASGLLKSATEFHLLQGRTRKEFSTYHLPEKSFIYLLCVLMERENSTRKVIHSSDWKLFLMSSQVVEEELLRLHQFGKLRFERAGSLLELTLPYCNTAEYIRSLAT